MKCSVIGIGSRASRDDEIGLFLVESLALKPEFADLRFLLWENADAATIAYELMEIKTPVLLVDCADMKLNPGDYRFFDEQSATLQMRFDSVSTHGLSLADGLEVAKHLGFDQSVKIFAVQPYDLSPISGLTPEMKDRLPELVHALGKAIIAMAKP